MLEGNTAPILPRSSVTVVPRNIYPTSPLVGCIAPHLATGAGVIDADIGRGSSEDRMAYSSVMLYRGIAKDAHTAADIAKWELKNNETWSEAHNSSFFVKIQNPSYVPAAFHPSSPAAVYRRSTEITDYLVSLLLGKNGRDSRIEPIDDEMWPGDLKHFAHTEFPEEIRKNSALMREFVGACLSDTDAISDVQILALAKRIFVEIESRWNLFAHSYRSMPHEQSLIGATAGVAFGRKEHHGLLRDGVEKFHCAVSLTDGCEEGREVKSLEEVTVRGFQVFSNATGEEYLAGHSFSASTNPEYLRVRGAGFLTGRDDYVCSWNQPSVIDATLVQNSFASAASGEDLICTFPKWKGASGSTELAIGGPILEYQGCFDFEAFIEYLNEKSAEDGFAFTRGVGFDVPDAGNSIKNGLKFGTDPTSQNVAAVGETLAHRPKTLSGIYSCQLQATVAAKAREEADAMLIHSAGVFALSANNVILCRKENISESVNNVTVLRESTRCEWQGCKYIQGSGDKSALMTQMDSILGDFHSGGGKVPERLCNAPCPQVSEESEQLYDGESLMQQRERQHAQALDMRQPQQCGSRDGKYHSIFVARPQTNVPVAHYWVAATKPEAPTWASSYAAAATAVAGGVKLKWLAPEFLGGHRVQEYELQFRMSNESRMGDQYPLGDGHIPHPSSHAMLCEVNQTNYVSDVHEGAMGAAGRLDAHAENILVAPTKGTDKFAESKEYRLCGIQEFSTTHINGDRTVVGDGVAYDDWFSEPVSNGNGGYHTTGLNMGGSTTALVMYLDPDKAYDFRVRAHTREGEGKWSSVLTATAGSPMKPASVQELHLDVDRYSESNSSDPSQFSLLHDQIRVRFTRPRDYGGGFLAYYKISLIELNCDAVVEQTNWIQTASAFAPLALDPGLQAKGGNSSYRASTISPKSDGSGDLNVYLPAYTQDFRVVPALSETVMQTALGKGSTEYRLSVKAVNVYGLESESVSTLWRTGDDTAKTIRVTSLPSPRVFGASSLISTSNESNWRTRRHFNGTFNPFNLDIIGNCAIVGDNLACESVSAAMDKILVSGKVGRAVILESGYHQAADVQVKVAGLRVRGAARGQPHKTVIKCGSYDPFREGHRGRCFSSGTQTMNGTSSIVFLHTLRDVTMVPVRRAHQELDEVNDSPNVGGAILINGVDHPVSLIDVTFVNFTARLIGGAIVVMDVPKHNRITLFRAMFMECDAYNDVEETYGAGLGVINAYVRVIKSTFRFNGKRVHNGGAIALVTHEYLGNDKVGSLQMTTGTFTNELYVEGTGFFDNKASASGGAVFAGQGKIHISGSQFGDKWNKLGYCDHGSDDTVAWHMDRSTGATAYGEACGFDSNETAAPLNFSSQIEAEISVEASMREQLSETFLKEAQVTERTSDTLMGTKRILPNARTLTYRTNHLLKLRSFVDYHLSSISEIKLLFDNGACLTNENTSTLERLVRDLHQTLVPSMDADYTAMTAACSILRYQIGKVKASWEANPANITRVFLQQQHTLDNGAATEESTSDIIWESTCANVVCSSDQQPFEYSQCSDGSKGGSKIACDGVDRKLLHSS